MKCQKLQKHIVEEHGLNLTELELKEIMLICLESYNTRKCYNCKEEVTMVSNGCICPNCYKEQ